MDLLVTIVIGFIIGVLAKLLHPGRERMGFILTTLLGIGGSMLASYVGQFVGLYQAGERAGFVAAVVGAVAILAIFGQIRGGGTR